MNRSHWHRRARRSRGGEPPIGGRPAPAVSTGTPGAVPEKRASARAMSSVERTPIGPGAKRVVRRPRDQRGMHGVDDAEPGQRRVGLGAPAEPGRVPSAQVLRCRGKHAIDDLLRDHVLESVIEHQPPDDPTAQAEGIEPLRRIVVERPCVLQRFGRSRLGCWCGRHTSTVLARGARNIRRMRPSLFCKVLIPSVEIGHSSCGMSAPSARGLRWRN